MVIAFVEVLCEICVYCVVLLMAFLEVLFEICVYCGSNGLNGRFYSVGCEK